jgi:hypothetical protein
MAIERGHLQPLQIQETTLNNCKREREGEREREKCKPPKKKQRYMYVETLGGRFSYLSLMRIFC